MKSKTLKLSVMLFVVTLAGCVGADFDRVKQKKLELDQTTSEEVRARLGDPYKISAVNVYDEQQIVLWSYVYLSTIGEADAEDVVPGRSQGFYFHNNILVGYHFTSSWKKDSTDFDSGKIKQIVKGESTKDEVVALLGKPRGKYVYPLIRSEDK